MPGFTIQAQDVTTTLAADGAFKVNKSDATTLFNLASDASGVHTLRLPSQEAQSFKVLNQNGNTVLSFGDTYNYSSLSSLIIGEDAGTNWIPNSYNHVQLQSEGAENQLSFISYSGSTPSYTNNILAYLGRGTKASPVNVVDGDEILIIEALGTATTGLKRAARIDFEVDGAPTTNYTPGKINFYTATSSSDIVNRMVIKGDGKVGIGTETPTSTLDINGSVSKSIVLISGTYTALDSDYTILATAATTLSLPDPTTVTGRVYVIKHGSGSFDVDISSEGTSKLIDTHASITVSTSLGFVQVQSTGAHWFVIGGSYQSSTK